MTSEIRESKNSLFDTSSYESSVSQGGNPYSVNQFENLLEYIINLPATNPKKIELIKETLSSNTLMINPENVAKKILEMEHALLESLFQHKE